MYVILGRTIRGLKSSPIWGTEAELDEENTGSGCMHEQYFPLNLAKFIRVGRPCHKTASPLIENKQLLKSIQIYCATNLYSSPQQKVLICKWEPIKNKQTLISLSLSPISMFARGLIFYLLVGSILLPSLCGSHLQGLLAPNTLVLPLQVLYNCTVVLGCMHVLMPLVQFM